MKNQYTKTEKAAIEAANKDWDEQAKRLMSCWIPLRDKTLKKCIERHFKEAGLK
jgi:hypothetical protein